ncbi:MAG: Hsp33 family molecular chaperone HslO, partial [Candidatus Kapaibacterium sp.]
IVQAMPGATDKEIAEVHAALKDASKFTEYLSDEMQLQEILEKVLPFEFEVVNTSQVDFFCRCTKKNFADKLLSFGSDDLKDMRTQGHNELVCRYCNSKYHFDESDFDKLITEAEARQN